MLLYPYSWMSSSESCDIRKDSSFAHFSDDCLLHIYFCLSSTVVLLEIIITSNSDNNINNSSISTFSVDFFFLKSFAAFLSILILWAIVSIPNLPVVNPVLCFKALIVTVLFNVWFSLLSLSLWTPGNRLPFSLLIEMAFYKMVFRACTQHAFSPGLYLALNNRLLSEW